MLMIFILPIARWRQPGLIMMADIGFDGETFPSNSISPSLPTPDRSQSGVCDSAFEHLPEYPQDGVSQSDFGVVKGSSGKPARTANRINFIQLCSFKALSHPPSMPQAKRALNLQSGNHPRSVVSHFASLFGGAINQPKKEW